MNERLAVMDLGTNTFHLLIVEVEGTKYQEIVHEHIGVRLGEGGINKGTILPDAFERGLAAMQQFQQLIAANNVTGVRAIATSAMRSAANGEDFMLEVKAKTGIGIEIIDGKSEAEYIYKGVKAGGSLSHQYSLIMDIGGGSVEFIICNDYNIQWKRSFEIGAARLMDRFHLTDPIPPESVNALHIFLEASLADLLSVCKTCDIYNIIGSSGAFETYAEVIEQDKSNTTFDLNKIKHYDFNYEELIAATNKLIHSSHQERADNKAIIPIRVDMIVVASLLTRFVIEKLEITNVDMSTNSLKEGVLAEMMG